MTSLNDGASGGLPNSVMSAPAEKSRPVDAMTTASTSAESRAWASASMIPVRTACPSALTGGLSMVMTATRPSIADATGDLSTRIVSGEERTPRIRIRPWPALRSGLHDPNLLAAHVVLHAGTVSLHVRAGVVRAQRVDARPFLDDRQAVGPLSVLRRDVGVRVDHRNVFDAALLGMHEGCDLGELGQERRALAGSELEGGDHVDHDDFLSRGVACAVVRASAKRDPRRAAAPLPRRRRRASSRRDSRTSASAESWRR